MTLLVIIYRFHDSPSGDCLRSGQWASLFILLHVMTTEAFFFQVESLRARWRTGSASAQRSPRSHQEYLNRHSGRSVTTQTTHRHADMPGRQTPHPGSPCAAFSHCQVGYGAVVYLHWLAEPQLLAPDGPPQGAPRASQPHNVMTSHGLCSAGVCQIRPEICAKSLQFYPTRLY